MPVAHTPRPHAAFLLALRGRLRARSVGQRAPCRERLDGLFPRRERVVVVVVVVVVGVHRLQRALDVRAELLDLTSKITVSTCRSSVCARGE
eukprot:45813-Rhodomonas_salina.1